MRRSLRRLGLCGLLFFVFVFCCPMIGFGAQGEEPKKEHPLLAIGKIEPEAIHLEARTENVEGAASEKGEPIVLKLKVAKKAYVTVFFLSPKGDATLLFPNSESRNNLLEPGQEYTLFGENSRIKLIVGGNRGDAKIVCFVSSAPVEIDARKIAGAKPFIAIPHSSVREMEEVANSVRTAAAKEGFNRQIVPLKAEEASGLIPKLMGPPKAVKSRKPGTVTGTQGQAEDVKGPEKE